MNPRQSVAEQIRDFVLESPGCRLDEIVHACPNSTWNQVFLEIDRLSRRGELILKLEAPGVYTVRLAPAHVPSRPSGPAVATAS